MNQLVPVIGDRTPGLVAAAGERHGTDQESEHAPRLCARSRRILRLTRGARRLRKAQEARGAGSDMSGTGTSGTGKGSVQPSQRSGNPNQEADMGLRQFKGGGGQAAPTDPANGSAEIGISRYNGPGADRALSPRAQREHQGGPRLLSCARAQGRSHE
jgi:hypothetical protein